MDQEKISELFKGELTPENRDKRLLALVDHLEECENVAFEVHMQGASSNWCQSRREQVHDGGSKVYMRFPGLPSRARLGSCWP